MSEVSGILQLRQSGVFFNLHFKSRIKEREDEVMKFIGVIFWGVFCCGVAVAAELPDVTAEAIADLGCVSGVPQLNGFVFIEGRYLPPPYTVSRKGNGLFINRIQFEQPVAWSRFDASDASGGSVSPKKSVDADGDFQEVGQVAAKPAAVENRAAPEKPKTVKSIDDLFADEKEAAPAAKQPAAQASSAVAPQPAPAQPAAQRTPEDVKRQKDELRTNLDNLRKGYEQALARGEVFFFGLRHSRLNGNYGTARTLMGVLPNALRQAQSPQDLLQRLNQGDIYFVDSGICTALFKNKNTFPMLEERLRNIEEAEELDASRRTRPQLH